MIIPAAEIYMKKEEKLVSYIKKKQQKK